MRSNYKRLGPYIREVDVRNTENREDGLLGLSVQKIFVTSKANTIGTDFRTYKIIKRNQFSYTPDTSRRGDKIAIALLDQWDEALLSPIYTVFEIINPDELLPEYLMMWFRRPEFDRYARFMSHGSVRELFGWEEMSNVELPIPSPEKQREIVAEYRVVVDRIRLNARLNEKLKETAQAIYRRWFVDFEFPMTAEQARALGKPELEGKPYKSSGGELVYNETLEQEIPFGWTCSGLDSLADLIDGDRGGNYPSKSSLNRDGYCVFLNAGNVTEDGFDFSSTEFISKERDQMMRKGKLKRNDIVLTTRGTVGNSAFYSEAIEYENLRINSGMILLREKNHNRGAKFIFDTLRNKEFLQRIDSFISGSAQQHLPIRDIKKIPTIRPTTDTIIAYEMIGFKVQSNTDYIRKSSRKTDRLRQVLLESLAQQ